MPKLLVIIASTRPGRVGLPVAEWSVRRAEADATFDVEVADLAVIDLPFMDEPNHPRLGRYVHEHTKRWSATVADADAFAFVMPEYNYGFNAPLKNAIDYLHHEWRDKPVGFVSYGGVSAGTRAVQMIKQVVTTLSMHPLNEAVSIPFVAQFMHDHRFEPNEQLEQAADAMLARLAQLERAFGALRAEVA